MYPAGEIIQKICKQIEHTETNLFFVSTLVSNGPKLTQFPLLPSTHQCCATPVGPLCLL